MIRIKAIKVRRDSGYIMLLVLMIISLLFALTWQAWQQVWVSQQQVRQVGQQSGIRQASHVDAARIMVD